MPNARTQLAQCLEADPDSLDAAVAAGLEAFHGVFNGTATDAAEMEATRFATCIAAFPTGAPSLRPEDTARIERFLAGRGATAVVVEEAYPPDPMWTAAGVGALLLLLLWLRKRR